MTGSNYMKKSNKAFSMLELVFVIVILGIVASISSSAIVDIYKSYIPQKASATASEKTEIAAMQIANRLANAVPWSVIAKDPNAPSTDFRILSAMNAGDAGEKYRALEWIGVDNDSFSANWQLAGTPAPWSGLCNTATATQATFTTNGSALQTASGIMSNLSNRQVGLNGQAQQPVVIFKNANNVFTNNLVAPLTTQYSPICMGMTSPANTSCAIQATSTTADTMSMSGARKLLSEHYVLAWSAYAIVPEGDKPGDPCVDNNSDGIAECNLVLYYNYQPWEGEQYANGTRATLLNNVTVFKFAQFGDTIRFKLCVQQSIANNANTPPITTCKEKVVIR